MALEQLIETAIKKVAKKMQFAQVVSGVAKNVTDTTCELHRTDAPIIFDVRLNAIDDDLQSFVTIYPKIDSDVLVGIIEGKKTEAVVLRCSEVEKVRYKIGDNTLLIDSTGVVLNNGTNGMIDIVELTTKVNALVQTMNTLIASYNSHIHVTTATVGASAIPGVINPIVTPAQTAAMFNKSDYENTKIKH
jgi:hypothetical protein